MKFISFRKKKDISFIKKMNAKQNVKGYEEKRTDETRANV